jgi:hypothetical protein
MYELTNALDALVPGLKEIANSVDFTYLHFNICRISSILNFSQALWNVANVIINSGMESQKKGEMEKKEK